MNNGADALRVVVLLEGLLSELRFVWWCATSRRVTAGVAEIVTRGAGLRWQFASLVFFTLATHAQIPLLSFERSMASKVH